MVARNVGHFQVIPRRLRARDLVPTIRDCSMRFKAQVATNDFSKMSITSERAWNAMVKLFEILRNEQDHGNLDRSFMDQPTAYLTKNVTEAEQQAMILEKEKLDKTHPSCTTISLREALNKIAHYDTALASYRIDGRAAHYLVLGGKLGNNLWVVEILVSRLCKNSATAIKAITG